MNTTLLPIIKQIIADNGEQILENPKRLKAFLGDLAKDEPKPLRIAFVGCLENGAYKALKTAPDAAERASRKAVIAQRVRDDVGLDPAISGEALDILEAAMGTTVAPEMPAKPDELASMPPITPLVQSTVPVVAGSTKKKMLRNAAWGIVFVAVWIVSGIVFLSTNTEYSQLFKSYKSSVEAAQAAQAALDSAALDVSWAKNISVNNIKEPKPDTPKLDIDKSEGISPSNTYYVQRSRTRLEYGVELTKSQQKIADTLIAAAPPEWSKKVNIIARAVEFSDLYKIPIDQALQQADRYSKTMYPDLKTRDNASSYLSKAVELGNITKKLSMLGNKMKNGEEVDMNEIDSLIAEYVRLSDAVPPNAFTKYFGITMQSLEMQKGGMILGLGASLLHPVLGAVLVSGMNASFYAGLSSIYNSELRFTRKQTNQTKG